MISWPSLDFRLRVTLNRQLANRTAANDIRALVAVGLEKVGRLGGEVGARDVLALLFGSTRRSPDTSVIAALGSLNLAKLATPAAGADAHFDDVGYRKE